MIELVVLYSWRGAAFLFPGKLRSVHLMTSSLCFRFLSLVVFVDLLVWVFFPLGRVLETRGKKNVLNS